MLQQDFGYLGVVLITAIIAGISVRIYRKAKREPSINNQLAYFYVLHVILFASVWWELRRSDIVATMLHNLCARPVKDAKNDVPLTKYKRLLMRNQRSSLVGIWIYNMD